MIFFFRKILLVQFTREKSKRRKEKLWNYLDQLDVQIIIYQWSEENKHLLQKWNYHKNFHLKK